MDCTSFTQPGASPKELLILGRDRPNQKPDIGAKANIGFNGLHVGFAESRIWQPDIKEVRDTRMRFYSETIHDLETKEVDSETNHVSETQAND